MYAKKTQNITQRISLATFKDEGIVVDAVAMQNQVITQLLLNNYNVINFSLASHTHTNSSWAHTSSNSTHTNSRTAHTNFRSTHRNSKSTHTNTR